MIIQIFTKTVGEMLRGSRKFKMRNSKGQRKIRLPRAVEISLLFQNDTKQKFIETVR